MALRTYTDPNGREWKVWEVPPRFIPERSPQDRRQVVPDCIALERRRPQDRRRTHPPREWVYGWICFETNGEKRRLCPLPSDWQDVSVERLEEYRRQATSVRQML